MGIKSERLFIMTGKETFGSAKKAFTVKWKEKALSVCFAV
ncbi:hypothetical protein BAXH7_01433 [Bacillus amyloliquefaciens XH7]|jgi:hypothetical protein|nr:hypothetical protein BAMTA208_07045 [Bacillus amyloliquefaciens TA208]AEB63732.1 hypothetical protein LL3_02195 [Bacillus amyloliquefaciens LL3]AEK88571.1 hypothetical protein BAXH7_01433 [Bacillus amyloliquefaciens XH7]KYC95874.1 hypothetical protein B425_2729 [Bacillus amyloliquefaciens]